MRTKFKFSFKKIRSALMIRINALVESRMSIVPDTGRRARLRLHKNKTWQITVYPRPDTTGVVQLLANDVELTSSLVQYKGKKPFIVLYLDEDVLAEIFERERLVVRTGTEDMTITASPLFLGITSKRDQGTRQKSYHEFLESGYIINRSGSVVLPKNQNDDWVDKTLEHYASASVLFKRLFGYDLYIIAGVLLGWARERDIIAHDKDFDIAFASNAKSPDELREELRDIIIKLLDNGQDISVMRLSVRDVRPYCFYWKLDKDILLDVFPASFFDGNYRRPTFVETTLARDDIFPLRKETLRGHEILIPANYEKKLAAVYGENWRTPDPFWAKQRSPSVKKFLKKISFTKTDLRLIAEHSPKERDTILDMLETMNL
jgi:hypothetical protein